LLASEVAAPVTATGRYPWQVEVKAHFGVDVIDRFYSDFTPVVVNEGGDPFGYGWSMKGLEKLVAINGGTNNTGMLWVSGTAGSRYFPSLGGSQYLSPSYDFGTLVQNADTSYAYTAKDGVKYNFDSTGLETSVVDPRSLAVTYSYSSGRLTSVVEPDGGRGTLSYDASNLLQTVSEPGSRSVSVAHN